MKIGDGLPWAERLSPGGGLAIAELETVTAQLGADTHDAVRPVRKGRRRRRRGAFYMPPGPERQERAAGQPASEQLLAATAIRSPQPVPPGSSGGAAQPASARLDRPQAATQLYGALDLGTNNCRLLVAAPRERGFRVVDAFSRIVRLGEGVGRTGRLGDGAMARAIEALRTCRAKLVDRGVERTRLIATEACRAAENGRDFLMRVKAETGLELEIVNQETEARLAVAGCASLVDQQAAGVILFDIGGGSTELVWIDLAAPTRRRTRMADRIRAWASLPVGVVTLSERHGGEEVTPARFEAMVSEVNGMLERFPALTELDAAFASGGLHMLGTSGTVTTLAGVHLDLRRYERRLVDGIWMSRGEISDMIARLLATDHAGRIAHPCIGAERADLVLAGCAILAAFHRRWPCDRLRVADRGLREGILVELMSEDGVWRRPGRHDDRNAPHRALQQVTGFTGG